MQIKAVLVVLTLISICYSHVSTNQKGQIQAIQTTDKLNLLIDNNEIVVLFLGQQDDLDYQVFQKLNTQLTDFTFGIITDQEVIAQNGFKSSTKLVLRNRQDQSYYEFQGEFIQDQLQEFVNLYSSPLLYTDFQVSYYMQQRKEVRPIVILFTLDMYKNQKAIFLDFANKYRGKIYFAIVKRQDSSFSFISKELLISHSKIPSIAISKGYKKKYHMEGKVNQENIQAFLDSYFNNSLLPFINGAPIPENNNGPVIELVAANFEDIVINDEKDVLVEYYAEWCGHCKAFAPTYEKIANKLQVNSNIKITRGQPEKNDFPFDVKDGYPTLVFYKRGKKNDPIEFKSQRDEEGVIQFLKENTSFPWVELKKQNGKDL